jgi:hypothetical protein
MRRTFTTISGCFFATVFLLGIFTSSSELGSAPLARRSSNSVEAIVLKGQSTGSFLLAYRERFDSRGNPRRIHTLRGGDSESDSEHDEERDKILDELLEQTAQLRSLLKLQEEPPSIPQMKDDMQTGRKYLRDKVVPLFADAAKDLIKERYVSHAQPSNS